MAVAPLAGAWIEIKRRSEKESPKKSRLLQARGLKFPQTGISEKYLVAPLAGAWIEINLPFCNFCKCVAPLAGAWIEIYCWGTDEPLMGRASCRRVD